MRRRPVDVGVAILLVAVAVGVTALLLNGPDESTPVSGAHSCNLMDTPYDTLATLSAPGEEWRTEIRDSGPNRHVLATITGTDNVLLGKFETIIKDRTKYYRESTPRNPDVYGDWSIVSTDLQRSFPPPCFDPGSLEEDASGSSEEPHFTSEQFLSVEEGSMRNEYWVDSTGRPTRLRRTIFPPEYDGVSNTDTGVIEFTYSGYGEANIIDRPRAPARRLSMPTTPLSCATA